MMVLYGFKAFFMAISVWCPKAVKDKEPNKVTTIWSTGKSIRSSLKADAALEGAIVCELEGPGP